MSQGGQVRFRRKQYYIAGPMTGIPQFNFPAFDAAAASLIAAGYLVMSPAELDDPESRAAALASPDGDPEVYAERTDTTWGDFLSRDVKLIADECDAVVALDGWEESRGARLEVFVARTCGLPVYCYEKWLDDTDSIALTRNHLISDDELAEVMADEVFTGNSWPEPAIDLEVLPFQTLPVLPPKLVQGVKEAEAKLRANFTEAERKLVDAAQDAYEKTYGPLERAMHRSAADDIREREGLPNGEVRITSETGGQKGRKPQRMDLLPPEALLALSEVYGMGAEKYDDYNYLKGYDWSLSFGALLRHVMAAEKGEWLDYESGLPHVMHAAWHCFALFMFEKHDLGHDDRLSSVVEGVNS